MIQPLTISFIRGASTAFVISFLLAACGGGSDASDSSEAEQAASTSEGSAETTAETASEAASSGDGTSTSAAATTADTSSSSGSTEVSTTDGCGISNLQTDVMQRINAVRATAQICGTTSMPAVSTLSWSSALETAAAGHSESMASNNYFSHTGQDGSNVGQRVTAAGYKWSAVGENIAAGQTSVAAVMTGWMASEGHCRNIMGAAFSKVAVACSASSSSSYGRYWTMVLAN